MSPECDLGDNDVIRLIWGRICLYDCNRRLRVIYEAVDDGNSVLQVVCVNPGDLWGWMQCGDDGNSSL